MYVVPGEQMRPPPGRGRCSLLTHRGRRRGWSVPVCPRSEVPLLAMPSFVSAPTHDDATVAFLLAQSLAARQQEEEAKEAKEVERFQEEGGEEGRECCLTR